MNFIKDETMQVEEIKPMEWLDEEVKRGDEDER